MKIIFGLACNQDFGLVFLVFRVIFEIVYTRRLLMYDEGSKVRWKWGDGYGHGVIQSSFTQKTTRKIGW